MGIKPRTMLGQAIDVFKKYIETKGNLEIDYHLEEYMQFILDYINNLEAQQQEFIKYLEDKIYSIEPKGTGIIYNCEYDGDEDYVNAMKEQSRLNTLKENLQKYKEIIGDGIHSLGTYKTNTRALEVLDEIQNYILLPNTDNSAYVYKMPEK